MAGMGRIYTEIAENQFDYANDWKETIADTQEGSGGAFTQDAHRDTLVGWVPWEKRRSAMAFFLGYSYADVASPWRLHRVNPHQHPEMPWLFAAGVTWQNYVTMANTENPNNEPFLESLFSPGARSSQYKWSKFSVEYRAWRCRFREDETIETANEEWRRGVVFDADADVQALSVDGVSQLTFFQGGGSGPVAGTTKFPAPLAMLLAKKKLVISWLGVAWEYLSSDPDVFTPGKLDACVGHINSDEFLSIYPRFTCLFNGYKVQVFSMPVPSTDTTEPLLGVNVQMEFEIFDPQNRTGDDYRGHVLYPWRGNSSFYGASRDGVTPGTTGDPENLLLPTASFADLFTHVGS